MATKKGTKREDPVKAKTMEEKEDAERKVQPKRAAKKVLVRRRAKYGVALVTFLQRRKFKIIFPVAGNEPKARIFPLLWPNFRLDSERFITRSFCFRLVKMRGCEFDVSYRSFWRETFSWIEFVVEILSNFGTFSTGGELLQ